MTSEKNLTSLTNFLLIFTTFLFSTIKIIKNHVSHLSLDTKHCNCPSLASCICKNASFESTLHTYNSYQTDINRYNGCTGPSMSWNYDPNPSDGSSIHSGQESSYINYNNYQSSIVPETNNNNETIRGTVLTQGQRQESVFDYNSSLNQTNDFENGDLFQPEEIFQLDQPLKPTNHPYNYNAINNNNVPSSTILNLDYSTPNLHPHLKYEQTSSVLEESYFPFIDERGLIQHQYQHFHTGSGGTAGDSYPCAQDSNGGSYYCNKTYFTKKEQQEHTKIAADKPLSIQIPKNTNDLKPHKKFNSSKFVAQPSTNYVKDIDSCLFAPKSETYPSNQIPLSHLQDFRENLARDNFEMASHGGSSFNQLYCGNGHHFNGSSNSSNSAMYLNTTGVTSYNGSENIDSSFQY